jgi:hypothetical protein
MEMLLGMVKQSVQEALKNFKAPKIKNLRKHKQVNELIGAQNKHQSETENTINRKINELKIKIDNIIQEGSDP